MNLEDPTQNMLLDEVEEQMRAEGFPESQIEAAVEQWRDATYEDAYTFCTKFWFARLQ